MKSTKSNYTAGLVIVIKYQQLASFANKTKAAPKRVNSKYFNWLLHFAAILFKVTHFTSLISVCVSNLTNYRALRGPLYSWSATHQSRHEWLVFILLIICDDLPVLVGVQSVEEIVTAVLPWRVRELEDRQE